MGKDEAPEKGFSKQLKTKPMSKRKFENKPKWNELPPKAQWIAMDSDGVWGWFATKPRPSVGAGFWYRGIEGEALFNRPRTPSTYWVESVEQRPV